jgi:hypothetical protein
VLFGKQGKEGLARGPATREALEREVADLQKVLKREDRLWVFFVGHAGQDSGRAAFHLAGRDLGADHLGKLFRGLACREQVFWMTTSASGKFQRHLSAPDRVVITASSPDEDDNETEFPEALAAVMKRPAARLDSDGDGKVSVLELYRHTVAEVEARFAAEKLVPTEHARLDDNGDGVGTEKPLTDKDKDKPGADGRLAARIAWPVRSGD